MLEEVVVDAIGARGGVASVVDCGLKFEEGEWCVIVEEVGWIVRSG